MKEKFNEIKEKVMEFYGEHKEQVNYILCGIACLFLGYTKGKADACDKLSDMNFTFRVKPDAREELSS